MKHIILVLITLLLSCASAKKDTLSSSDEKTKSKIRTKKELCENGDQSINKEVLEILCK